MPLKTQSVWLMAPRGYIQKLGDNDNIILYYQFKGTNGRQKT